jgi:hypothetical protein
MSSTTNSQEYQLPREVQSLLNLRNRMTELRNNPLLRETSRMIHTIWNHYLESNEANQELEEDEQVTHERLIYEAVETVVNSCPDFSSHVKYAVLVLLTEHEIQLDFQDLRKNANDDFIKMM